MSRNEAAQGLRTIKGCGQRAVYYLGHYHVPRGSGECQREGCTRDAVRAWTVVSMPDPACGILRSEFIFLWLCLSCADAGGKAIDGEKEITAAPG